MADSSTGPSLQASALSRYQAGQYADAAALFEQAAAAYRAAGDRALAAEMGNNLGVVHRAQKNLPAALQSIEAALAEFRSLGDRRRTAQALGNLGSVLLEGGDLDRAAQALAESLDLFDPLADKAARSEVLRVLGEVRLKQGEYIEGMADYEAGLRDVEKPTAQQRWLRKLLERPLKMLGLR